MKLGDGIGFSLLLGFILMVVLSGHCAVGTRHANSLGVPMYTSNPLAYLAGSIATNQDAVSNVDGNLNVRMSPLGTYMLYDESVLLCGLPMDKFQGITEPFVLTYERVARRTVQGIGCHVLISVDSLKPKEKIQ